MTLTKKIYLKKLKKCAVDNFKQIIVKLYYFGIFLGLKVEDDMN